LIHQYMSLANTSGLSYWCAVYTFGREETTRSLGMMELLYVELCQHANPKQTCGKLGCQRKTERLRMLGASFWLTQCKLNCKLWTMYFQHLA
jgi:hypothetical protein